MSRRQPRKRAADVSPLPDPLMQDLPGPVPLSEAEVLARTDVSALMQGFARAREAAFGGRCPWGSPTGCRCAHCYQDGSVQ